jgi:hypothetical protein
MSLRIGNGGHGSRRIVPSRRPARATLVHVAVAAVALAAVSTASADVFEPISLVSDGFLAGAATEDGAQQALYAHDPAISADGRYVAFDGSFGGFTGVWRRDLQSGEVQPVAVGAQVSGSETCVAEPSGAQTPCDAELPSISADGRYVSFTTTAPIALLDDRNKGPDVYVRDMDAEPSEQQSAPCAQEEREETGGDASCPFTLVSAVNGKTEGLAYEHAGGSGQQFEEEHYGSLAGGRSALSADGRHVAFVTSSRSNLAGPETPALQVAVRDLDTRETQLVSVAYDRETGQAIPGSPVSGVEGTDVFGAVYVPGSGPPAFPVTSRAYKMTPPVGASLSADASTVAWMGQDVSEQTQMLPAETLPPRYTEPLWRRIAAGTETATRRVTGGSDPANPACAASGETVLPEPASSSDACQGPFATPHDANPGIWAGDIGDAVPQLSANGMTVAFLATATLLARGSDFGVGLGEAPSDLYVADMHEGLTRDQALRALTEFSSANRQDLSENAPIVDLGVSPDGTQVAFTTARTEFPLGSPAYVSAPAPEPGLLELLDADLANDTLTRVTHGFEGGASEQPHPEVEAGRDPYGVEAGALSPSFSADGDTLAFSSTASNLAYGDGNTPPDESSTTFDGSDAFAVERRTFSPAPTPQAISSAPAGPALLPAWGMGVTARSLPNGSVRLYIQTPGIGKLSAAAQSAVAVRVRLARAARGRSRGARGSARGVRVSTVIATRKVATAVTTARSSAGEILTITLTLAKSYSALAGKPGGLSATVSVLFVAQGHPALRESVPVTFLRVTKPHPAKHRSTKRGSTKRGSSRSPKRRRGR